MKSFRLLLYPFALLYGIVVYFRNMMFDIGVLRSKSFPVWVISVGNLSVGGTGKSPHIEYLIRLMDKIKPKCTSVEIARTRIAVLSRGYGRKTSGYRAVLPESTAEEAGDEPVQVKRKFNDIFVAVDEKRARGVKKVLEADKDINLFLLDDAVQHRYVTPAFSILLTNFHKPFYEDHLMPAGTLREQKRGYKRADIIVVTRTPANLPDVEKRMIIKKIAPLTNQNVFFSSVNYLEPVPVFSQTAANQKIGKTTSVLLLTGIANANDLRKNLESRAKEVFHMEYGDHHPYSLVDIMKVVDTFNGIQNPDKMIITTEKDSIRLHQPALAEHLGKLPIYYIPITIRMHDEDAFADLVARYLNSFHLYKPLKKAINYEI